MSLMELAELLPAEATPRSSSSRASTPAVPLSAVEDLVETVVVLRKDHRTHELGLSVVGGSDTYLGCVVVQAVSEGGAAWQDGRLQRGDILLQVNDTSLATATREMAVSALRSCSSPARLLVLREDPETIFTTTEEPSRFITVELRKSSTRERLGLSLMERSDGNGIFVTLVEPGGLAARCGRILQGDKLLEVNGIPVSYLTLEHVAANLRSMEGSVVLQVGRVPALARAVQEWSRKELPERTPDPARLRIQTWSHSRAHARHVPRWCEGQLPSADEEVRVTSGETSSSKSRAPPCPKPRVGRLPRPPSLFHVLRRSLRSHHALGSGQAIVRTLPHDASQGLHRRTEVVFATDDSESCGSDKPFLSDVQVTSF
ncbi:multiple PDZ domain protein-like [Penaeus japonicus]|uniref:multiple PDZ domain protein-like n=1 Tax=Penaeus japonicus TaxID=27405 RepID=UPI001C70D1FB|nr:multiple PDZ domain protein-like [Penaeus japonicus]